MNYKEFIAKYSGKGIDYDGTAGVSCAQKKRSDLTASGQKNALNQSLAVLKSGTVVAVSEVKKLSDKEYWGRIPSGWICLMFGGVAFVK